MTDGLLTVREAGRLLRVSDESVYRLCRKGELGAIRIGGLWRIPREAVYRILGDVPPSEKAAPVETEPAPARDGV